MISCPNLETAIRKYKSKGVRALNVVCMNGKKLNIGTNKEVALNQQITHQ